MPALVAHLALAAACGALFSAGFRVAASLATGFLERAVAGVTFTAAAAGVPPLILGAVQLGSNAAALLAVTAVLWLLARRLVSDPSPTFWDQLRGAWATATPVERAGVGAGAAALLALTAFALRYPHFGSDGMRYHLSEVVYWIREGTPGSIEEVYPGFPVGNYPLASELILSWAMAIARGHAVALLWSPGLVGLLFASAWLGLRAMRVPRGASVVAALGLCLAPLVAFQITSVSTDIPALAWLVTAAGLGAAAVARDQPGLIAPTVLAAGLAAGAKTTALPLACLTTALVAFGLRDRLRDYLVPTGLAGAAAIALGGFWYLRNLILHGSPSWPFLELPWSDPPPDVLTIFGGRFIETPALTLREYGELWLTDDFGGGALLIAAAVLAPLVARTKAVAVGAAVTVLSVALWTLAPVTGRPEGEEVGHSLHYALLWSPRYLLPGVAVATLTVCLAVRDAGRRWRLPALAILVAVVGLNFWQTFEYWFPLLPRPRSVLLAALIGAGLAVVVGARARVLFAPIPTAALAVALAMTMAWVEDSVLERFSRLSPQRDMLAFVNERADDGRPLSMSPTMMSVLAGKDFERKVEAIPHGEPCEAIRRRAREGWVITEATQDEPLLPVRPVRRCLAGVQPVYRDVVHRIYRLPAQEP